ncbi:hypothetical protein PsYK624_071720 [Phanerochaete sordida]|uniref:Alpha/beta-hydrolase n=1 Tax=Phanerochaete sordida TaxID=48140 RepID=A0A9P3GBX3_9APHY|nr:hypothetical protein PsYK624_071720 [Phanerochaete sordida]
MPLAQIDDKGTSIYYEDSGAPDNYPTYSTVVLVHGAVVNSASFAPMLPLAAKHGLRIITMNNRDYRGSSPYTPEELADFRNPDVEVQASAVRRWGREVGQFLAYVCQTLHIPATVNDGAKQAGGVTLLTWSLSCIAPLAILGDARTLGDGLAGTLAPYFRRVILYDPPASVYGVPPWVGSLTSPFVDPTIPPERKMGAFLEWVSAHCSTLPPGVPISVAALEAHSRALPRPPTLHTLSPEMLERCLDRDVGPRSLAGVSVVDPSIHQRHVRTAVGDADAVLPGVDVLSLWCDGSVWLTTWGAKTLGDVVQEPAEAGKKKRKVSFLRVRGANHFFHCDEPERMVQLLADSSNGTLPVVDSVADML